MRTGQVLSGRYTLGDRIGLGGMGEVWRATDARLERTVAIKLLRPEFSGDAESRQRFRQEALTLASLDMPGTARIYDSGEDEVNGDLRTYLVMEYVPGTTLARILAERGPLPSGQVLPILSQIARALDMAHRSGIVHRDIKPTNIMVSADGTAATLLDFGIAQSLEYTRVTLSGQIMGTLSYVSPEQINGGTVGPESDIYSLGAVAFECFTGAPPFGGEPLSILNGHLREVPPELPQPVTGSAARAIRRALAKAPQERFPSASEFVAACGGMTVPPVPRRGGRATRVGAMTSGALVLALVAALLVFAPWGRDAGTLSPPESGPGTSDGGVPEGLDEGTLIDSQDGVIYKVDDDGDVYWYRHKEPTKGKVSWAKGSGKRIGGDWKGRTVVAGYHGILYAIDAEGDLYWYRHTDPTGGTDEWSEESGTLLGRGFDKYIHVVATTAGVLYTAEEDGRLRWHKHSRPKNGAAKWLPNSGMEVGSGWDETQITLASGGDGIIYAVRPNGDLVWHYDDSWSQGTKYWDMTVVAEDWDKYESIVASASGVIYARTPEGKLYWFRHLNPDNGFAEWDGEKGKLLNPS